MELNAEINDIVGNQLPLNSTDRSCSMSWRLSAQARGSNRQLVGPIFGVRERGQNATTLRCRRAGSGSRTWKDSTVTNKRNTDDPNPHEKDKYQGYRDMNFHALPVTGYMLQWHAC
jgi:hypothetical protein